MITQEFDLNLIPEQEPVVVHVDQYDHGTGRLVINLYDGDTAYPVDGTAIIQGIKPDGHGFTYSVTVDGSQVTADLTEQMSAVAGDTRAQIVVTESDGRTGTFVFILRVQKSALPDDSELSDSDYQMIEDAIEAAASITLPLPTTSGGTGNTAGYIQTGRKSGTSIGYYATAEGHNTTASGQSSHAEGDNTVASGFCSHAEGGSTTASASYGHTEGNATTASALATHAEGYGTTADYRYAHAEGWYSASHGEGSHAEGGQTQANGKYSHAEGVGTRARYDYQHVGGKYNDNKADTLLEIGNGTTTALRSNAFEVYANGDINVGGEIKVQGQAFSLGKWTTPVSCLTGDATVTITDANITTGSTIIPYSETSSGKPVGYSSIAVTTGQAVITFSSALTEGASIKLNIL